MEFILRRKARLNKGNEASLYVNAALPGWLRPQSIVDLDKLK